MNWEPLPPRKKSRIASRNENKDSTEERNIPVVELTMSERIQKNIEERARVNRTQTTLESRDGCASEYYEYLDHTADVQCHAWGKNMSEAFQHMAECMLNYMTDIDLIKIDPEEDQILNIQGHDMESLLFNYMHELLFKFNTDYFCAVKVEIIEFDRENYKIRAKMQGDIYDPAKHTCGTEIKAITYSNMQIHEKDERVDLFVIVDI